MRYKKKNSEHWDDAVEVALSAVEYGQQMQTALQLITRYLNKDRYCTISHTTRDALDKVFSELCQAELDAWRRLSILALADEDLRKKVKANVKERFFSENMEVMTWVTNLHAHPGPYPVDDEKAWRAELEKKFAAEKKE